MCVNCKGEDFTKIIMPCKVCELVDGDKRPKGVVYCEACKAYICAKCVDDWGRRTIAAAKNWGNKIRQLYT